jgi:predicted TIM-barrel fold metal-dependent hydrolase
LTSPEPQPVERSVTVGERYDTCETLRNARAQAEARGLDDVLIVDADAHHYENTQWREVLSLVEDPTIRRAGLVGRGPTTAHLYPLMGNQDLAGRIVRYPLRNTEEWQDEGDVRDLVVVRRAMEQLSIDYTILFPSFMLTLGLHPVAEVEVAIARAYARWLKERILTADERIGTMLYLPMSDPEACLAMVEEFGDMPGNRGFMVTASRFRGVHNNAYAPLYRAIEERGLPLAFHASYTWNGERMMEMMNRFLSVHALGFCFFNMIHLANWIVNGMPERFPKLKVIWVESGLAWLPFMMQRLDHEFVLRSSEAPLLTRKPSEYMREMYYTSQPLERTNDEALELTFDMIDAPNRLLYASDYPHWDFDTPSRIWDIPFLDEQAKRNILGLNGRRFFGLEDVLPERPMPQARGVPERALRGSRSSGIAG